MMRRREFIVRAGVIAAAGVGIAAARARTVPGQLPVPSVTPAGPGSVAVAFQRAPYSDRVIDYQAEVTPA